MSFWSPVCHVAISTSNNLCGVTFKNSFINAHPVVYQLVDVLRREQNKVETDKIKVDIGKLKAKADKTDDQVIIILNKYDPSKKIETLKKLSLLQTFQLKKKKFFFSLF